MLCHGEHNPNNMFLLSKDKKDLINFCGGQCFAPLGKSSSSFFSFPPFHFAQGTDDKEAAGRFALRAEPDGGKGKEDYRLAGVRRTVGAESFDQGLCSV